MAEGGIIVITSLKDCDKAFMDRVRGCKVENENGELVDVPVIYINPDEELLVETYPCFVVMRVGAYPDVSRWNNGVYYSDPSYNSNGEVVDVVKQDAPQPYALYYAVKLFYQYPQDGADMTFHILNRFKRGAYLEIDNEPYDLSYVSYRNQQSNYKDFGEIKDKDIKQFVEQYQYRLDIDIAPRSIGRVKISRETNFNIYKKDE